MATNPVNELASTIQFVSVQPNPDPDHDINPSTTASTKVPANVASPSLSSASDASIPSDVIKPRPRKKSFPPIPDFRFEQSYLASLKGADTPWKVAYITVRDQVLLPLMQGLLWNLATFGWRHWNKGAKFSGQSFGARVRRWWWEVNHWKMPEADVKIRQEVRTSEVDDFFAGKFGSSTGD